MIDTRQELGRQVREAILELVDRVPISELPEEGTHSLVDNGGLDWLCTRRCEAIFKEGRWVEATDGQALTFQPTYWVRIRK
jgi:citrate lyase gamma subunit